MSLQQLNANFGKHNGQSDEFGPFTSRYPVVNHPEHGPLVNGEIAKVEDARQALYKALIAENISIKHFYNNKKLGIDEVGVLSESDWEHVQESASRKLYELEGDNALFSRAEGILNPLDTSAQEEFRGFLAVDHSGYTTASTPNGVVASALANLQAATYGLIKTLAPVAEDPDQARGIIACLTDADVDLNVGVYDAKNPHEWKKWCRENIDSILSGESSSADLSHVRHNQLG